MPSVRPRELFRRVFSLLTLLLACAPPFVLIAHRLAPGGAAVLLLVPALCGVIVMLIGFFPNKARAAVDVAMMPAGAALAVWAAARAGGEVFPWGLLYAALCAVLTAYAAVARASGGHQEVLTSAFLLHAVCGVVALRQPYASALYWLSFAYLACFLVRLVVVNLRGQCPARDRRSARGMLRGNLLLCAALMAGVLVIAEYRRLKEWSVAAVRALIRGIVALLSLFQTEAVEQVAENAAQDAASMLPVVSGEPALFWVILEKIVLALAYVGALALVVLLLWRLPRLLRRIADKIRALLSRYFGALNAEYTDEEEAVSGWSEWSGRLSLRARALFGRFRPARPWREMDNRQRVRSIYARLRSAARDVPASATARETLTGALPVKRADARLLAESYDRARYSDHEITAEEAENARRAL